MKLTYIHHSCYLLEFDSHNMLIDFYEDTLSKTDGDIHHRILEESKPLYILCTHHHYDHYNSEILKWKQSYKGDIKYIFSTDVKEQFGINDGGITFLEKGDNYQDERLSIKVFGSTDAGISYLVKTDSKLIFHAGDLNNWHWKEECSIEESAMYERNYLKELNDLATETKHLDLAMFPIDPRLGKEYMLGAQQFLDEINVSVLAPMHFQDKFEALDPFKKYADIKQCLFFIPTKRGDNIKL